MARDFIKVDRTTTTATHATLLVDYRNTLRRAYELGIVVRDIMNHNHAGSDFSDVEALFGLPEGKGQIVYDLVNGSIGSMSGLYQVADAKNLTETLG